MIDSIIATSHNYYVIYLKFERPISLPDIIRCFTVHNRVKSSLQERNLNYSRFQLELPYLLGLESVLQTNKGGFYDNKDHYWYDFYINNASTDNSKEFFLCYPYAKLSEFIEYCFSSKAIEKLVLKPQVPGLLTYLKIRGSTPLESQKTNLTLNIIKYSASVQEPNAKKINIFGDNPLESMVYELVSAHSELNVEPLSLRLKCSVNASEILEISFDKLGNGRFWMKKNNQENTALLLPQIFKLFQEINNGIKESLYINRYNLLESEDDK